MVDYKAAHKHCFSNREELLKSKVCGCFYCLEIYFPLEIEDWTDFFINPKGNTALCPKCSVDSVVGDASGFAITCDFLKQMNFIYFSK